MATPAAISIEQYLSTVYEPDVDYVDGELEERHVGEYEHNVVQKQILFWFDRRAKEWRIRAVQEQRTRLGETRVRIPDVSVFPRDLPIEQVFTRPQLIAIEVLSPEDRHSRMDKKSATISTSACDRFGWSIRRQGLDGIVRMGTGFDGSGSKWWVPRSICRWRNCSPSWMRLKRVRERSYAEVRPPSGTSKFHSPGATIHPDHNFL